MGTPMKLNQAVINGLLDDKDGISPDRVTSHIKDYLANKFASHIMNNPEIETILLAIYRDIIK